MNAATISMDRWQAREQFLKYRRLVAERGTKQDAMIMETYKQLAMGRKLLSLSQSIARGGLQANGLPALAIVRADAKWCLFNANEWHFRSEGSVTMHRFISSKDRRRPPRAASARFESNIAFAFEQAALPITGNRGAQAQVPIIPLPIRPKSKLENYHILFEANWTEPPKDPLLLRRINKDIFIVLAQWDLTEVERMVLGMARTL